MLTKKDTDALLGRLDERSDEQLRRTTAIEVHLQKINGTVGQHSVDIQALTTTIFGRDDDKGMAGWVRGISTRSKRNTILITSLMGILSGMGILEWQGIIHLFR